MDIYSKYDHLAVRINCLDSKGSGCFFQPFTTEYSYVLTARHCLEGKDKTPQVFTKNDIKIRFKRNGTFVERVALDYYLHKELDLAVIKIEYIDDIPSILTTIPKDQKSISLYGFPEIMQIADGQEGFSLKPHRLSCSLNFIHRDQNIIQFTPEPGAGNLMYTLNETVLGFSGSGIYYESNDELYLIGIFTQLQDPDAAYNSLEGHDILAVNKILSDNNLLPLVPEELLNFQRYIETAFESNEGYIKSVLKQKANFLSNIQPNNIVTSYNEKLYLPYNSFIEEELLNVKLWEGWISLLTYYHFEDNHKPLSNELSLVRYHDENEYEHSIKMYFTPYSNISNCIKYMFTNNYDDMKNNDLIVINTKGSTPGNKSFTKDKAKKILRSIDRGEKEKSIEKGFDIDDPDQLKNVEFIHIDLFKDEFSSHYEIEDIKELKEKIKGSIKEVFNHVHK